MTPSSSWRDVPANYYGMRIWPTSRYVDPQTGRTVRAFDGNLLARGRIVVCINGCSTAEECFRDLVEARERRIRDGVDA